MQLVPLYGFVAWGRLPKDLCDMRVYHQDVI